MLPCAQLRLGKLACHSERSEESPSPTIRAPIWEILRFAQNDMMEGVRFVWA
jgi:hypothetical protein